MLGPEEVDAIMGIFKLPVRKLKPGSLKRNCRGSTLNLTLTCQFQLLGIKGCLNLYRSIFLVICKFYSGPDLRLPPWVRNLKASRRQDPLDRRCSWVFRQPQIPLKESELYSSRALQFLITRVEYIYFIHSFHRDWTYTMCRDLCGIKRCFRHKNRP